MTSTSQALFAAEPRYFNALSIKTGTWNNHDDDDSCQDDHDDHEDDDDEPEPQYIASGVNVFDPAWFPNTP